MAGCGTPTTEGCRVLADKHPGRVLRERCASALHRHLLVYRHERMRYQRGWKAVHGRCEGANTPSAAAPSNYGAIVNRVRNLISPLGSKPMWNFVEVGWPFTETASQGARTIAPEEIRAAVWHSLIAGARGIIYFNHSFGGPCTTQNVLRSSCGGYPAVRAMVTSVNAQIQSIAGA